MFAVKTRIYHLVFFFHDLLAYLFFKGCNFQCRGCILKLSPWDCHIPVETQLKLSKLSPSSTLSLSELSRLIEDLKVERVVLGGGEPTLDRSLPYVVRFFKERGVYTVLLTNGYLLDEKTIEALKESGLDEVCISLKALDPRLHRYYTRRPNERVLRNFRRAAKIGVKVRAESVLIPGLIDIEEIERISKFIASVDRSIPFRVDGYVRVPGQPWRSATPEEVVEAASLARRHLDNVSYIHSGLPVVGGVLNLYPRV
ncbi:MAG: radical SAM protein [Thermoprotei archaeon]|nr:MAG: radical SAM protein [Thermoprotei archaeon]